jgi:hypothetical protein
MEIEDALQVLVVIFRRFKWAFVLTVYAALFAVMHMAALVLIVPFILLSALAYAVDKQRERDARDDFSGGWLFYRYGSEIDSTVLPLPAQAEWSAEQTMEFGQSLQASLASRIVARLPASAVEVAADCVITDQESGEKKSFIRLVVRSHFGSMLTHFIHYASFGRTITAHYFTFLRGSHGDWAAVKFILESPLTIWFWGIPWLRNRHSIAADLSAFRASSFDGIDLRTMATLTSQVVYEETAVVLDELGLLTEDVKRVLNVHIQNFKLGKQQVMIKDSPGARIEGVSLALPSRPHAP